MTEYKRLEAHLPSEVEELICTYLRQVYRIPNHVKCIKDLFNLLKKHTMSFILFNESVLHTSNILE